MTKLLGIEIHLTVLGQPLEHAGLIIPHILVENDRGGKVRDLLIVAITHEERTRFHVRPERGGGLMDPALVNAVDFAKIEALVTEGGRPEYIEIVAIRVVVKRFGQVHQHRLLSRRAIRSADQDGARAIIPKWRRRRIPAGLEV